MVFVIHRGGDYVGDLRVSLLEPNQSAGKLVRSTDVLPLQGDQVTDAISQAALRTP